MTDSSESQLRYRVSALPPSATYTFSHIFPPETTQSDFFIKTTLPLVRDALQGQNALLFTYGVTNSGKTYTIQGGTQEGSAGILPRSLDVLFNSIDGLHGDGRVRVVSLMHSFHSSPTFSIGQFVYKALNLLIHPTPNHLRHSPHPLLHRSSGKSLTPSSATMTRIPPPLRLIATTNIQSGSRMRRYITRRYTTSSTLCKMVMRLNRLTPGTPTDNLWS